MKHQVFISYDSADRPFAIAICNALEEARIPCWIASRDLTADARKGGSIVDAIQASKAILVVFSKHADASPQMSREIEIAVSKRLQPIPVRVANAMPTGDMEYFLGVSHWFNAYPQPFRTYLPQIVEHTRRALSGQSTAWKRFSRRLPNLPGNGVSRYAIAGLAIVAAIVTALVMKRMLTPNPMDALKSPMAGRWEANITDANGKVYDCVFDAGELGQLNYSDGCPYPFAGAQTNATVARDGTWAPQLFIPDKDTGTFLLQGGTLNGAVGAFRMNGRNRIIIRTAQGPEIEWKRIKQDAPPRNAASEILPPNLDWPLKGVPAIAQKALAYARSKWQPDAVLTSIKAELIATNGGNIANGHSAAGPVQIQFSFYSPGQQQGMTLMPNSPGGEMIPGGPRDPGESLILPEQFLDLPDAVAAAHAHGMRAHQIKNADLENWEDGTSAGGVNFSGVEWMIDSALDERFAVPALSR